MYTNINGYTFKVINPLTKKSIELNHSYQDATDISLRDAYQNYSAGKENAFDYCMSMKIALNGKSGYITSHNTFTFCYAFTFEHPETGVLTLAYITPSHNYITDLI